jgi:hypothetical protein
MVSKLHAISQIVNACEGGRFSLEKKKQKTFALVAEATFPAMAVKVGRAER